MCKGCSEITQTELDLDLKTNKAKQKTEYNAVFCNLISLHMDNNQESSIMNTKDTPQLALYAKI